MAFETSKNAEDCYNFLIGSHNTASYNLLISDNSKIIAIGRMPLDYIREDVINVVVRSNTFISDSFQKLLIKQNYSKKRQKYAEIRLNELYGTKELTDEELINLLVDEPIICRLKPYESMTIAFLTKKYFGIGNAKHNKLGRVPLEI